MRELDHVEIMLKPMKFDKRCNNFAQCMKTNLYFRTISHCFCHYVILCKLINDSIVIASVVLDAKQSKICMYGLKLDIAC